MGAEAVDWVTRKAKCERESAISLLRLWEALGDFGHVVQVMGGRGREKERGGGWRKGRGRGREGGREGERGLTSSQEHMFEDAYLFYVFQNAEEETGHFGTHTRTHTNTSKSEIHM